MRRFVFLCLCAKVFAESDPADNRQGNSPFLYGEWLYWQTITEDPMNWQWIRDDESNSSTGFTHFNDETQSLNFDFTSGFRLGTGYRFSEDALGAPARPWEIEAIYTQYTASARSGDAEAGIIASSPDLINDYITNLLPTILADVSDFLSGHSQVKLRYQRADLLFGWPFGMGKGATFQFYLGPSFGWVQENWTATWLVADHFGGQNTVDFQWKWWGGGIHLGTDFDFPIGKGLAFFFRLDSLLAFGKMEERETYFYLDATRNQKIVDSFRFSSFQPEVGCAIGIDYNYRFHQKVLLNLATGWEVSWWPSLNQFGRINDPSYSNNRIARINDYDLATPTRLFDNPPSGLILHGLYLKAGLAF